MVSPPGLLRPRAWVFAVLALVLPLGVAVTRSTAPERRADGAAIVASLPDDLQLVIRIRDADLQRQSPAGQAIAQSLGTARLFSETGAAWERLSALLGWNPDEAFSRLTGQSLVLAVGRAPQDGERPWSIICDVDRQTERRLIKALRPAPRQVIAGQPVLSLEDGRFELAIARPLPGGLASTRSILILAPAGRGDLMERVVLGLAGRAPGPTLADSPALAGEVPLPDGDILVLAMQSPDDYVLASASLGAQGWHARIHASPGAVASLRQSDGCPPAWSAGAINSLAPRAIFLMVSDGLFGLERWAPMFALPTLPEAAERLDGLLGRRVFLGMFRTADKPTDGPGVTLALGLAAPDIGRLAAPADAVLARLIAAAEIGPQARESDRPDFEGFMPQAPRSVPLLGPVAAAWHPILGPTPAIAWIFQRAAWPADSAAGWWIMTIGSLPDGPQLAQRTREIGAALAHRPEPGTERPRITAGLMRISELVRWLSSVNADPTGELAPLACIDTIRWDVWVSPDGRAEGTLDLLVAP